jgi:hypothetical protein
MFGPFPLPAGDICLGVRSGKSDFEKIVSNANDFISGKG